MVSFLFISLDPTFNVPQESFTNNLASDIQSVAFSDGKIKVKATVSERKLDKRPV
jgi:hypothetical protein